jgi:hypothetical protein
VSPPGDPAFPTPDPRELASRIVRTRSDFGRVYDEVRAALTKTRPFIAISAGAMSDGVAFERALRQADEEGWYQQLGERLMHDGFLVPDSAVVTQLQALLSRALGFPDASVVEQGGLRARARLCRVEVAVNGNPEAVIGTGFLVGPSAVLTAFHVVAGLVDPATGMQRRDSERQLRVRFDHATGSRDTPTYPVRESWLAASSRPHDAELALAQGVPQLVLPGAGVDLRGCLDYAVIILAASPGSERGYYDVEDAVQAQADGTIHLFQHPMGVQQRITSGTYTGFRDATDQQRINHTANALTGSSGGLLLDGNYALVGLHQGAHGQPVVNTGISAIAIRDHIRAQGANLLDASYVPASRVADGSRPILGRVTCQEWVRRGAKPGSKPLVRVKPFIGSRGVSFTGEIMRVCLPVGDHVIRCVQVLELDSDAMTTAAKLLDRLGVDAAGLPTEAAADTSRGAWLGQLVQAFGARVEEAHGGRTVWLLIDDLQKKKHAIPAGSVREFLSELYKQSTNFTCLRIVLLGLADFPSGFPNGFVDDEAIAPPQLADIVSYVRIRLTQEGIAHSAAEAARIARLIQLTAGDDIASLSDYVADKVDRALSDGVGVLP